MSKHTPSQHFPSRVPLMDCIDEYNNDLERFFLLAIQIAETVGKRHQINHTVGSLSLHSFLVDMGTHHIYLLDKIAYLQDYLSPEQKGGIQAPVDHRSDLFSIGVCFYYILCKEFPRFDSMGQLISPFQTAALIPKSLALIIEKLLSRFPEDRYLSMLGLLWDLNYCLTQLRLTGSVSFFYPGSQDTSSTLIFGDFLYGRSEDERLLKDEFFAAEAGQTRVCLIKGYAGVGKTILVEKTFMASSGLDSFFFMGKSDQINTRPFSALLQAIRQLLRQCLDDPQRFEIHWPSYLATQLPHSLPLLSSILPELDDLLSNSQAPALVTASAPLSLIEEATLLLRCFVESTASFVMYMDDIQWLDTPSFLCIKSLLQESSPNKFLFIAAYRITPSHIPDKLADTLRYFDQSNTAVKQIHLVGISEEAIYEMMDDLFQAGVEQTRTLSRFLHHKTLGNPFFVKQLLLQMVDEDILIYDSRMQRWTWELSSFRLVHFSDNVADLVLRQLSYLPERSQRMLMTASFFGNQFSVEDLSLVTGLSEDSIALDLWQAVCKELIAPLRSDTKHFCFLHDKFREASYSLSSRRSSQRMHAKIACSLLEKYGNSHSNHRLFELAYHMGAGQEFIHSDTDRINSAILCLRAGKMAMKEGMKMPLYVIFLLEFPL